jgi:hypothetical protein
MNKHTPGPWNVSEEFDGTSIKAGMFHVTHTIQACGFHEPEEDKAVTQANARLIAAAPELLAAAQAMLACCYDLERNDETIAAVKATMQAIAKATGKLP